MVLAQTEELPVAPRPQWAPVYGDTLSLATLVPSLTAGQMLALTGVPQHLRVAETAGRLRLLAIGGSVTRLSPGDRLILTAGPSRGAGAARETIEADALAAAIAADDGEPLEWLLEDRDGNVGTVTAPADAFELDSARKDDPWRTELVRLIDRADAVAEDRDRTHLRLAASLTRAYDRRTVQLNANVAPATHGETVSEILGSGNAGTANQRMALKQVPLTFVSANTPSGRRSTLDVRVNDLRWTERETLYQIDRRAHDYVVRIADDGTPTVAFGDGVEGARLATGQSNVRARYRKGLGAAGNVRAGQLTTLLSRPLGVQEVHNPERASGGEDPERLALARQNAPLTVLTLDRAVSRRDYEDFARRFAGIEKADALWIARGIHRGIVVTVAGPAGAAVADGGATHQRLSASLREFGDPLLGITVRSYTPVTFALSLDAKVDERAEEAAVLAAVRTALTNAFTFEARTFGQTVSSDEVAAVAHRIDGVEAVDIKVLRRADQPTRPPFHPRLPAAPATAEASAELLTLDPTALEIGVIV